MIRCCTIDNIMDLLSLKKYSSYLQADISLLIICIYIMKKELSSNAIAQLRLLKLFYNIRIEYYIKRKNIYD